MGPTAGTPGVLSIVKSILSLFTGSLYLPSPSTCYQNSAGTTQGAVDQPVGLMLDSMGVLGPELVTNDDFGAGSAGWSLGAGFSVSSGALVASSAPAFTSSAFATVTPTPVVGRVYRLTYDLVVTSGSVAAICGAQKGSTKTASGTYTDTLIASSTAAALCQFQPQSTFSGAIDNISVKEITGNHATQATAGFRPILRGAVKNLVAWSEDLTNAAWGKAAITVAGSVVTATNPLHALYQVFTVVPGITYTYQFKSKRGSMSNQKYSVYNVTGAVDIIPATSYYSQLNSVTDTVVSVTFTAPAGCTSVQIYPLRDSEVVGDCTITENQVEIGSVANPYVPTTTAPASSSYGPYWLDFDGVDDRLQLASVPFQLQDNPFATFGFLLTSTSAPRIVFSTLGASSGNTLYTNFTSGIAVSNSVDDTPTTASMADNTAPTNALGLPRVMSFRHSQSTKNLRRNGVQVASSSLAQLNSTNTSAYIGGQPSGAACWSGLIYSIALGKGAITDAQLLQLEKYAGSQCGVVI